MSWASTGEPDPFFGPGCFTAEGLFNSFLGCAPKGEPLKKAPPPGTPLHCALTLALEHSGVYLGGGLVAELHGSGDLRAVSLDDFLNGEPGDPWRVVRTGYRILAACDGKTGQPLGNAKVAERARRWTALKEGKCQHVKYSFVTRNCHRFTAGCVCGRLKGWGGRTWAFPCLERIIAYTLAPSHSLMWREVPGTTPGFEYEPSEGKQAAKTGAKVGVAAGGVGAVALLAMALAGPKAAKEVVEAAAESGVFKA